MGLLSKLMEVISGVIHTLARVNFRGLGGPQPVGYS